MIKVITPTIISRVYYLKKTKMNQEFYVDSIVHGVEGIIKNTKGVMVETILCSKRKKYTILICTSKTKGDLQITTYESLKKGDDKL